MSCAVALRDVNANMTLAQVSSKRSSFDLSFFTGILKCPRWSVRGWGGVVAHMRIFQLSNVSSRVVYSILINWA